MVAEKRRSDRIMLTVPLRVQGTDDKGPFQEEARTLVLNRHGARIRIRRRLRGGQKIRLANSMTQREAEFRVVGAVAPFTDEGGEFGVEYLNRDDNIWGIQFPPMREGEAEAPKAILECHECRSVVLVPVSLVEVEVLETSGILTKHCERCGKQTAWSYSEQQISMGRPGDAALAQEVQAAADGVASAKQEAERRRYRRIALQMTVRIRNYSGGAEISRTENISKGGFCFISANKYRIGEGVMVVCPYNPRGQNLEVHGRVVCRRAVEGSDRFVYGVRYEP